MYSFIHDKKELKKFFDMIIPDLKDFEVYFLSLSCRKKYLSQEERDTYHITRAEMFERKLIRKKEWDRFLRAIRKYETNFGSYISKNGLNVPSHALVLYWNINPSNSLKSLKEFQGKMIDWQYEFINGNTTSYKEKFNKLDVELMNCYQRNPGTKKWLDIDIDIDKDVNINIPDKMRYFLKNYPKLIYYWVDTKSGWHLLIDRNTLDFNPNDICKHVEYILKEFYYDRYVNITDDVGLPYTEIELHNKITVSVYKENEVKVNKNAMIPLPGCLQGSYPVKVLWDFSKSE